MYYVYVIRSKVSGILYKGLTKNIAARIKYHNSGKVRYTKSYCPWELVYKEEVETLYKARKREKYLKSGGGRRYIEKILNQK